MKPVELDGLETRPRVASFAGDSLPRCLAQNQLSLNVNHPPLLDHNIDHKLEVGNSLLAKDILASVVVVEHAVRTGGCWGPVECGTRRYQSPPALENHGREDEARTSQDFRCLVAR